MDSTTVSLITHAATQLGITGAQAFGWWLAVKVCAHLLWATFCAFSVWRVTKLLESFGWGQRVLGAWAATDGSSKLNGSEAMWTRLMAYIARRKEYEAGRGTGVR